MIDLEEFVQEDIAEALALWQECEHIGLSRSDDPQAISKFLDRNPGFSFVARRDRIVVGAILCGHDARRGYVYHLAVLPGFRLQGLGSKLLDASMDALCRAGVDKCHAAVFSSNPFGKSFWVARGWERRNDLQYYSRWTDGR